MKWLIGPEILWGVLYALVAIISKKNSAPAYSLDKVLENLFLYVPLAALLTFALWYLPLVEKRGLMLRVWIVCLVAGHLVLQRGLAAYSDQGPGIGTAYMVGMLLLFVALVMGSILVRIIF